DLACAIDIQGRCVNVYPEQSATSRRKLSQRAGAGKISGRRFDRNSQYQLAASRYLKPICQINRAVVEDQLTSRRYLQIPPYSQLPTNNRLSSAPDSKIENRGCSRHRNRSRPRTHDPVSIIGYQLSAFSTGSLQVECPGTAVRTGTPDPAKMQDIV